MLKLSHSAKSLYDRCPMSYYIKYMLNLHEKIVGSSLPFGSAIDEGVGVLGETRDLTKALAAFEAKWATANLHGQDVDLKSCNFIKYSKADLDPDLFEKGEIAAPWESMRRKGRMMIEAYNTEIMPKIKKVIYTQKPILITNQIGDVIRGFLDKVVEWEDGRIILFDDKTSAKAYPEDKIQKEGQQLAIYKFAIEDEIKIDAVGYLVMEKVIRKKAPRARVQVLIGNVTEEFTDKTIQEYNDVIQNIKLGRFESKHPDCHAFYGACTCTTYNPDNYNNFVHVEKHKK